MKLFSFVPGWSSIVVAPSLWTSTMTVIVVAHVIFKTHCHLPHHLWVWPNEGNTFGNVPWNDSQRKILYKKFQLCHFQGCIHTMSHGRMQQIAALLRGKSCSAYAANLIVSTLKKTPLQRLQKLWNETSEFSLIFFSN